MAWRRAILISLLGAMLAACVAVGPSSPPPVSPRTDAPDLATAAATAAPTQASPSQPATPEPILTPTLDPTSAADPPKPSGVSFGETREGEGHPPSTEITQTVRWTAPTTEGVEIRVYGVTECVAEPADPPPGSSGPCLVEHTPLPASVRRLLATAPASEGAASWTWTGTFDCEIGLAFDPHKPAYHSIVLAAYSESGRSIFAIAVPGGWWRPGLDEIVC